MATPLPMGFRRQGTGKKVRAGEERKSRERFYFILFYLFLE